MNKVIKYLKNSTFIASFSLLASGSIIAQLFGFLASPMTTRLFTPEQLGKYTVIITAVSIFGPIISLKYDMSIIIAKNKTELNALVKLSFIISIILSIVTSIVYGILLFNDDFGPLEKVFYICTIMVLLLGYGINNILLAHNNKNGFYKLISTVTMLKSGTNSVLIIVFGLLKFDTFGLVLAQLISSFSGIIKQSREVRKELTNIIEIPNRYLINTLKKYKRQPIFNASAALVTTTVYSSINLFVRAVYSYEQLGLYSLSYKVLGIPFTVISANIARIYYDTASKEKEETGTFTVTYLKTLKLLVMIIIPMIGVIALISPFVFSFIFGKDWVLAGYYVRYLSPMFAIRLIVDSLTTSFIIAEKQHIELLYQTVLLFGEIIIFVYASVSSLLLTKALLLISCLYVLVYSGILVAMYKISKHKN